MLTNQAQLTVFVILLCAPFMSVAQNLDSTRFETVMFKSDFEREIFHKLDEASSLELLLMIQKNMSHEKLKYIEAKLSNFCMAYDNVKFHNKKEEKKIKTLFTETHDRFFSQYKEISYFNSIFYSQEYNCVSATALYALIFDELNIPYTIKQAPTHVYAVAYPLNKDIIVESTAPLNGYYALNDMQVREAVTMLIKMKLVTQEEVDLNGPRATYTNYFFDEENINMRQLAGLQYYNESVSHVQDVAYEKALNSALKASIVYPSERIDFLITSILAELLNMGTAYNMKQIKYINIFSETPSADSNRISANLDHMFHKHIIKDGNLAFADSAYEYLTTHLSSPFLVNKIKEFYHTYYCYYYYETGEGMKGLPHAELAYAQNNKNVQLQSLIYSLVINDLRSEGANNEHGYLKELNAYAKSFPFLLNRKDFQRIKVYAVAATAYDEFADKQLSPGLSLLDTLDQLIELYPTQKSDQKASIVRAFGKGSMLYYKRGQYYKALEVVQRGLAYYPKDAYLLERKSYILREL